jgi:Rtf2 RING-finger
MGGDGGVIAANRKFLRQCGDAFLTEQQKLAQGVDQRERKQLRSQVQCIVDAPVALAINKPFPFSLCSTSSCSSNTGMHSRVCVLLPFYRQVCAVSNEKLQLPIVTCELGYLYNKDAVLTALLERTLNPTFAHLRGLKDLIELKVKPLYDQNRIHFGSCSNAYL